MKVGSTKHTTPIGKTTEGRSSERSEKSSGPKSAGPAVSTSATMSSTGGPEPVRAGLVDNVRSQIAQGTFEQNVDMEKVVDGIMADL